MELTASFSLTEISSHGFIIIASGAPSGSGMGSGQTKVTWMTESLNWAEKADGKWAGKIDMANIGAAGQSCGGLEASDISITDARIKATGIFNSGYFGASKAKLAGLKSKTIGYCKLNVRTVMEIHADQNFNSPRRRQ